MLRKVYFEVRYYTRLANWMFQYAAAKSLCSNVACVITDDETRHFFEERWPFEKLEIVDRAPADAFIYAEPEQRYHRIDYPEGTEVLFIKGFFQSDKYFDKAVVRRQMGIMADRKDRLLKEYAKILAKPNVTGLSVRRGDYLKLQHCHPFVGEKYYRDCFSRLPEVNDFIVCSDDIAWCKNYFPKAYPEKSFYFMEGSPVLDQLYIHTLCKNMILSNSTFCWWSAWLNEQKEKKILAPSLWFGFALSRKGCDWSDLYFEGVEVVDNGYDLKRWIQGRWCLLMVEIKSHLSPVARFLRKFRPSKKVNW